jgi:hypothetical protein
MGLHMFASDLLPLPEAIIPHGIPRFVYGVPPGAQLLLALPLAALFITAVLVVRTGLARGARRGALALATFVLLQAGFAAFLHYWNLPTIKPGPVVFVARPCCLARWSSSA